MSKRISRGLADFGGIKLEPFRPVQDHKVAIDALFACILDGRFACTKKPGASPGGLTDNPHAPRIEAEQEVRRSGCWQLARKVAAGHEMRRHGDLLVICSVHKVCGPAYRFEFGKRVCA